MSVHETDLRDLGASAALRFVASALAAARIENPEGESRILFFAATGLDRAAVIREPDEKLSPETTARLRAFLSRRIAGEPATRIAGSRPFWTLDLRVTRDVLDPRPDTETVVEAALQELGHRRDEPLRVLDLGTGTGALLLALLSELPKASGLGVDLSPDACEVARDNAQRLGFSSRIEIRQGRWTEGVEETFDLVVSNPPYIETGTIPSLAAEVRHHDPMLALDGGPDGLDAYRTIVSDLPGRLKPKGIAVLELGAGQLSDVASLARNAGLVVRAIRKDLGGVDRALALGLA